MSGLGKVPVRQMVRQMIRESLAEERKRLAASLQREVKHLRANAPDQHTLARSLERVAAAFADGL